MAGWQRRCSRGAKLAVMAEEQTRTRIVLRRIVLGESINKLNYKSPLRTQLESVKWSQSRRHDSQAPFVALG